MALQAEVGVALEEHFLINRAVWVMTRDAAFSHGVMFENKRAFLSRMTFGAGIAFTLEAAGAALNRVALMRVMTIGAAHLACHHGMAVRKTEFAALIEMALETGLRRFAWVDDRAFAAACSDVFAARTVTAFAALALGVFALNHELGVRGTVKILNGFFVALRTFLFANERGSSDVRRRHNRAIHHGTRDKECRPQGYASEDKWFLRPTTWIFSHWAVGVDSAGLGVGLAQCSD